MKDRSNLVSPPRLAGYESWLFQRPCPDSVGDVFVSTPIPAIGGFGGGPTNRWLIALGDVSGRGEPTSRLRDALESELARLLRTETDPALLLKALNMGMIEPDSCGFATLIVTAIDGERHELSLANAGSLPPLLRRSNGRVEELGVDRCGPPLFVFPGQTYETVTVSVGPGDVIVFTSDGVTAVIDGEDRVFDHDRLKRAISQARGTAAAVGQSILEAIRRFDADRVQQDDITLLCLGRIARTRST